MFRIKSTMLLAAASSFLFAAQAQPANEEAQMKAYMEALRKDIRTERQSIVDQAMGLEAGDKAKFWGVYEKYSSEMKSLWDKRLANIKKYADNFESLTPAVADELAAASVANQQQSLDLLKKYHPLMKSAVGAKSAARFVQVETVLNSIMNMKLGASIPLMPQ